MKIIEETLFERSPGNAGDDFAKTVAPNNPPWNSTIAILVWMASVALIAFLPLIVITIYLGPIRGQLTDQASVIRFIRSDPTAVLLQILSILPAHILTLALSWAVVTRFRKYGLRETLGWRSGGMRWWHYVLILAGVFALSAVVVNIYPEADNDLLRMLRSSRAAVFAMAILATFTAPLVEEIVYRGLLYSAFQRAIGVIPAVAAVTFLFAFVHVPQYWPSFSTLFLLTSLSLVLTLVRARTGNLLPCIILHTIFNGLQSVGLILEPYFSSPESSVVESAMVQIFR